MLKMSLKEMHQALSLFQHIFFLFDKYSLFGNNCFFDKMLIRSSVHKKEENLTNEQYIKAWNLNK